MDLARLRCCLRCDSCAAARAAHSCKRQRVPKRASDAEDAAPTTTTKKHKDAPPAASALRDGDADLPAATPLIRKQKGGSAPPAVPGPGKRDAADDDDKATAAPSPPSAKKHKSDDNPVSAAAPAKQRDDDNDAATSGKKRKAGDAVPQAAAAPLSSATKKASLAPPTLEQLQVGTGRFARWRYAPHRSRALRARCGTCCRSRSTFGRWVDRAHWAALTGVAASQEVQAVTGATQAVRSELETNHKAVCKQVSLGRNCCGSGLKRFPPGRGCAGSGTAVAGYCGALGSRHAAGNVFPSLGGEPVGCRGASVGCPLCLPSLARARACTASLWFGCWRLWRTTLRAGRRTCSASCARSSGGLARYAAASVPLAGARARSLSASPSAGEHHGRWQAVPAGPIFGHERVRAAAMNEACEEGLGAPLLRTGQADTAERLGPSACACRDSQPAHREPHTTFPLDPPPILLARPLPS